MPINVNIATYEELKSLPSIGEKRAKKIMEERESRGHITPKMMKRILGCKVPESLDALLDYSIPRALNFASQDPQTSGAQSNPVNPSPIQSGMPTVEAEVTVHEPQETTMPTLPMPVLATPTDSYPPPPISSVCPSTPNNVYQPPANGQEQPCAPGYPPRMPFMPYPYHMPPFPYPHPMGQMPYNPAVEHMPQAIAQGAVPKQSPGYTTDEDRKLEERIKALDILHPRSSPDLASTVYDQLKKIMLEKDMVQLLRGTIQPEPRSHNKCTESASSSEYDSEFRMPSRSGSHKSKKFERKRQPGTRKTISRTSNSGYYFSSGSSSSEEESPDRSGRRHGDPRRLPRNLHFDGKTSWLSFKQKFQSYQRVNGWSGGEAKDYLMWCLEGPALDYFTYNIVDGDRLTFRDVMKKMEGRFGAKELPETSRAKFQQASQKPGESLEEWSDRVLILATPAFRDLPERYRNREAVDKFCQGCLDKEAGKYACLQRSHSMQKAVDQIRHHQYISHTVDNSKRKPREVAVNAVDEAQVGAVGPSPSPSLDLSSLEKALNLLTSKIETLQSTKNNKSSIKCFYCQRAGHVKKDCYKWKQTQGKNE